MIPGDQTQWYQCGNPDEFMYMDSSDALSSTRSPFMKEQTVLNGAFAYTFWKGNCDLGMVFVLFVSLHLPAVAG